MKKYTLYNFKVAFLIWAFLAIGTIPTSILYATLSTFGVARNTSLLISLIFFTGLILLSRILLPKPFQFVTEGNKVFEHVVSSEKDERTSQNLRDEILNLQAEAVILHSEIEMNNIRLKGLDDQLNRVNREVGNMKTYVSILEKELEKMRLEQQKQLDQRKDK